MEELKISKDLISEVLGCDCVKIEIKDKTLEYDCDFDDVVIARNINIYEFAFKCMNFADRKGYDIYLKGDGFIGVGLRGGDGFGVYWDYEFIADIEIEAIFKACNWILEQDK